MKNIRQESFLLSSPDGCLSFKALFKGVFSKVTLLLFYSTPASKG